MTADELRNLVEYDAKSGVLYWKNDHKYFKSIKAGDIVGGSSRKNGYASTAINKKQYYVHRLVWLLFYGSWPEKQIDHINGIRDDNRIENLRLATASENQHNRKKTHGRKTPVGAYKHWSGKWYSSIMSNGKYKFLGTFENPEDASNAYASAKAQLHPFNPAVPTR